MSFWQPREYIILLPYCSRAEAHLRPSREFMWQNSESWIHNSAFSPLYCTSSHSKEKLLAQGRSLCGRDCKGKKNSSSIRNIEHFMHPWHSFAFHLKARDNLLHVLTIYTFMHGLLMNIMCMHKRFVFARIEEDIAYSLNLWCPFLMCSECLYFQSGDLKATVSRGRSPICFFLEKYWSLLYVTQDVHYWGLLLHWKLPSIIH